MEPCEETSQAGPGKARNQNKSWPQCSTLLRLSEILYHFRKRQAASALSASGELSDQDSDW